MSSVITLNYTNTLEKILNLSSGATTKGFDSSNTLRNLIHVHGILGQSIIIGVDNETQIKNDDKRTIESGDERNKAYTMRDFN